MRTHQFELDSHRSDEANIVRLRAYIRHRFGKSGYPSKKGIWARGRAARLITCKPWKR